MSDAASSGNSAASKWWIHIYIDASTRLYVAYLSSIHAPFIDFGSISIVARHSLYSRHIDAIQKHRKFTRTKLNRRRATSYLRQPEDSQLRAVCTTTRTHRDPTAKTFNRSPRRRSKDEQMCMKWVLPGHRTRQLCQTIEAHSAYLPAWLPARFAPIADGQRRGGLGSPIMMPTPERQQDGRDGGIESGANPELMPARNCTRIAEASSMHSTGFIGDLNRHKSRVGWHAVGCASLRLRNLRCFSR